MQTVMKFVGAVVVGSVVVGYTAVVLSLPVVVWLSAVKYILN